MAWALATAALAPTLLLALQRFASAEASAALLPTACATPAGPKSSGAPREHVLLQHRTTVVRNGVVSPAEAGMGCHSAVRGEACYMHVRWAMDTGIHLHPQWYPGLTSESSFGEFQAHMHEKSLGECPEPCKPGLCHTAVEGEECHKHVMWAVTVGIGQRPEWYPDLTNVSLFEQFQALLNHRGQWGCPAPCGQVEASHQVAPPSQDVLPETACSDLLEEYHGVPCSTRLVELGDDTCEDWMADAWTWCRRSCGLCGVAPPPGAYLAGPEGKRCCYGHYGPGGAGDTLLEPEKAWSCTYCNCRDLSKQDGKCETL
mmetsp:Transcript_34361/g.94977  ORF Transcript_34361/g.94977 Transcript_34361/m.94977 type:complete len:315 (-) Transcript_34361:159-1103(-)